MCASRALSWVRHIHLDGMPAIQLIPRARRLCGHLSIYLVFSYSYRTMNSRPTYQINDQILLNFPLPHVELVTTDLACRSEIRCTIASHVDELHFPLHSPETYTYATRSQSSFSHSPENYPNPSSHCDSGSTCGGQTHNLFKDR